MLVQFYYIYLNLESNIQALILPQLQQYMENKTANNTYDYNIILDQLIYIYNNSNKIKKIENRLYKLK